MAESDAAGPAPADGPRGESNRTYTLADAQREAERSLAPVRAAAAAVNRSMAPLRAAATAVERSMAPVLAIAREYEESQRRISALVDNGIGRVIREMLGHPLSAPPLGLDPPRRVPSDLVAPADPPAAPARPTTAPPTPPAIPAHMADEIVNRIADEVVRRLSEREQPVTRQAPATKGRRGRKTREMSVGGVDAALEALAEGDASVKVRTARELADDSDPKTGRPRSPGRIPYSRRTIENSATYKLWRKELREMRADAKAQGVSDALEAGLLRVRSRKPGRERLRDETDTRGFEAVTKALLSRGSRLTDRERAEWEDRARNRLRPEEGLDGQ